jgi:hypothetical protein
MGDLRKMEFLPKSSAVADEVFTPLSRGDHSAAPEGQKPRNVLIQHVNKARRRGPSEQP